MYFCRSWFSRMVSFKYVLVFLTFFYFMSNKQYLILLNFTTYLFSVNTIFLLIIRSKELLLEMLFLDNNFERLLVHFR